MYVILALPFRCSDVALYFLRFETCYQIALAIKKEVEDLEAGGIQVGTVVFVSHL
jgi:hypothetical protein